MTLQASFAIAPILQKINLDLSVEQIFDRLKITKNMLYVILEPNL
ncbi:hypothetical protein [Nostoc sp. PCC 7107]|nr:hypothetical protein [Nostoc sp. PCC 7107]AFY42408.1 hypothetical protein Nos7107_1772 [Nostoc sp. PCC 7107]